MAGTMFTDDASSGRSPRQHFLDVFEREHQTTLRVLRGYPDDKLDLRPGEKSMSARELVKIFVLEQWLAERAMTEGFDWSSPPPAQPELPPTIEGVAQLLDERHRTVVELVRDASDEDLAGTVKFFTAPKTLGDVPKLDFLWGMIYDQIHHRGQLSVYLRVAGAKVPSIYGPSADEPWT
ncbi:MAG: DinB family protein [Gemmatimonadetes bacterium]|nr:DinB family protein [Gemmatimonadota bacterium]